MTLDKVFLFFFFGGGGGGEEGLGGGGERERGIADTLNVDTLNVETVRAIFYCHFSFYYNWSTSSTLKE